MSLSSQPKRDEYNKRLKILGLLNHSIKYLQYKLYNKNCWGKYIRALKLRKFMSRDYVIVPHHLGREYATQMKTNKEEYDRVRNVYFKELNKDKRKSNYKKY